MNRTSEGGDFRADVQGLRAIAVMLVVLYHAGVTVLPGGYVGVDVFFVISGYLITGMLFREYEKTRRIDLPRFYARRIRRLLPAACIVLIVTVAVAWFVYSPFERKQLATTAFATAVYLSNVWFAFLSTDYLAADTHLNPLLHTWSLAVEEQFYLFWPLLFLVVAKKAGSQNLRRRLLVAAVLLCVGSLALSVLLTRYSQPWAFFGTPTRAWEFALGGMFALGTDTLGKIGPRARNALGWIGLLAIFVASVSYSSSTPFPGFAAVLPAAGASLVLISYDGSRSMAVSRLLGTKPMQWLGELSYSWYLWHWPILVFMYTESHEPGALGRGAAVLISLLLAWLTCILVENPVRFSRKLSARTGLSLGMGVLLTISTAGLCFTARTVSIADLAKPAQQRYSTAANDLPRIYEDGCHASFLAIDSAECVYGNRESGKTVVLFGDSHAAQWFPALEQLAIERNWRLVSLTKSACPSVMIQPHQEKLGRPYTECTTWQEKAIKRIAALAPSLVILSNSSAYLNTPGNSLPDESEENWRAGVRQVAAALRGIPAPFVFIRDTPRLRFDPPTCLARADWRQLDALSACGFSLEQSLDSAQNEVEAMEVAGFPDSAYLDMTDAVCPASKCATETGDMVVYRDWHHLTATFARHLAVTLFDRIPRELRSSL